MGEADFARMDALRRAHFPPERNHLPAHLTMFHALPPSCEAELKRLLGQLARRPPPAARFSGVIDLGGGVAYRIASHDLEAIRAGIADHFHGSLTAQDDAAWKPHVTVQNKVSRNTAAALFGRLSAEFRPAPLILRGLE